MTSLPSSVTATAATATPPAKNPLHIPSAFVPAEEALTDAQKEQRHVHDVYEVIAPHFSATRYKPWPVVEDFLLNMPPGFLGADVGCGNGKYIGLNPTLFMIGSDRSSNLIRICVKERNHEALVADGLSLSYRSNLFDFAISIAVIHHFMTPQRRIQALKEILRIVKIGGQVLCFVWALEQKGKREFAKDVQDVFVPWALPKKTEPKKDRTLNGSSSSSSSRKRNGGGKKSRGGDAAAAAAAAANAAVSSESATFTESGIQSIEGASAPTLDATTAAAAADTLASSVGEMSLESCTPPITENIQEPLVTPVTATATATDTATTPDMEQVPTTTTTEVPAVLNRYYHLFQQGELEELIVQTEQAKIIRQGYDRDNWWCVFERTA